MKKFDRRSFLKTSAAGAGIALLGPRFLPAATVDADLGIATGEEPEAITRAAVDAVGGIGRFVSRDDVVLLKPNIGWDRLPNQAANTNPVVVATMTKLCIEAGAKRVLVMDNSLNDARRCYTRSGIYKAATDAGAEAPFMNVRRFKLVNTGGTVLGNWPVYQDAIEVDTLINLPVAKHHSLSRLSLGMKNLYGLIGGPRHRLHQRLDEGIADLAGYFRPKLTVLDAYRILKRNGPQGGRLSDTELRKTVIAGTDPVAVDARGAELFGLTGADLGFVRVAAERGIGTYDLSKLNIKEVAV